MINPKKLFIVLASSLFSASLLSGCSFIKPKTYEVRWANYSPLYAEHKVYLDVETYKEGEIPVFKGKTPTRNNDDTYTYTFTGWSPEIGPVTQDIEYNAVYQANFITFTIKWLNYDNTLLKEEQVKKGDTPSYDGETPKKEGDAQYSFVFTGWDQEIIPAYMDRTYTAQYERVINSYKVTFKDEDGTVLQETEYQYGQTPVYSGKKLQKKGNEDISYFAFTGWDKEVTPVTEDVTYVAQYEHYDDPTDMFTFIEAADGGYMVTGLATQGLYKQIINLKIPSEYNHQPVRLIKQSAFAPKSGNSSFKTISIPSSVTYIGENAFANASLVEELNIPTSVTTIKNYAFENMKALKEVFIPDSVTSIGKSILKGCTSFEKITVPFFGASLEEPSNLNYLFSSDATKYTDIPKTIKEVVIGDKCTTLGGSAFYMGNNITLEKAYLPKSITNIKGSISVENIYYKGSLKDWVAITFDGSGNSIKKLYTFENDEYVLVETADISSAPTLNKGALSGIDSLTSISLSTVVNRIPKYFLTGSNNLTSIAIPSNINYIDSYGLSNCDNLEAVTFNEGLLEIADSAFYYDSKLNNITLPNTLLKMGDNAFSYCTRLTSISVPDSVNDFGTYVFSNCQKLETAYIGTGVKTLLRTFVNCKKLQTVTANGVESIVSAFKYCNGLVTVNAKNLTSISTSTFEDSPLLEAVNVDNDIYTSEDGIVYNKEKTEIVLVPRSKSGDIEIPNTITSIGESAFLNCKNITSIVLPDGLLSIGNNAFSGCSSMVSINIPNTVTTIGSYAFYGCNALEELIIPDSVTTISENGFNGTKLKRISIPFVGGSRTSNQTMKYVFGTVPSTLEDVIIREGITGFVSEAFKGCSNIKKLIIPDSVTAMPFGVLKECTSLRDLTLPFIGSTKDSDDIFAYIFGASSWSEVTESVPQALKFVRITDIATKIPVNAFKDCKYISEVYIGNNVTTIAEDAFYNCYNLTYMVVGEKVNEIHRYAFYFHYKLVEVTNKSSLSIVAGASSYGNIALHAKYVGSSKTSYLTLDEDGFYLYRHYDSDYGSSSWKYYVVNYIGSEGKITVPSKSSSTIIIDAYAFYHNNVVTDVNTGTTRNILASAFEYCSTLKTVTFGGLLVGIGNRCFFSCNNLTTLTFNGTTNAWLNVSKGASWNSGIKATYVTCTNGTYPL